MISVKSKIYEKLSRPCASADPARQVLNGFSGQSAVTLCIHREPFVPFAVKRLYLRVKPRSFASARQKE